MTKVLIDLNEEQNKMIEDLKPIFNTKARTKVLIGCLNKTHEFFTNQKK